MFKTLYLISMGVMMSNIKTTPFYWDCECKEDYIHPATEDVCDRCFAEQDNQPESRVDEIVCPVCKVNRVIKLNDWCDDCGES